MNIKPIRILILALTIALVAIVSLGNPQDRKQRTEQNPTEVISVNLEILPNEPKELTLSAKTEGKLKILYEGNDALELSRLTELAGELKKNSDAFDYVGEIEIKEQKFSRFVVKQDEQSQDYILEEDGGLYTVPSTEQLDLDTYNSSKIFVDKFSSEEIAREYLSGENEFPITIQEKNNLEAKQRKLEFNYLETIQQGSEGNFALEIRTEDGNLESLVNLALVNSSSSSSSSSRQSYSSSSNSSSSRPPVTPTIARTPTRAVTPTRIPTATIARTPTRAVTNTPIRTNTPTPGRTSTRTPTFTPSRTPTKTLTPTKTSTFTPSRTPSKTPTPSRTPTVTPTPTLACDAIRDLRPVLTGPPSPNPRGFDARVTWTYPEEAEAIKLWVYRVKEINSAGVKTYEKLIDGQIITAESKPDIKNYRYLLSFPGNGLYEIWLAVKSNCGWSKTSAARQVLVGPVYCPSTVSPRGTISYTSELEYRWKRDSRNQFPKGYEKVRAKVATYDNPDGRVDSFLHEGETESEIRRSPGIGSYLWQVRSEVEGLDPSEWCPSTGYPRGERFQIANATPTPSPTATPIKRCVYREGALQGRCVVDRGGLDGALCSSDQSCMRTPTPTPTPTSNIKRCTLAGTCSINEKNGPICEDGNGPVLNCKKLLKCEDRSGVCSINGTGIPCSTNGTTTSSRTCLYKRCKTDDAGNVVACSYDGNGYYCENPESCRPKKCGYSPSGRPYCSTTQNGEICSSSSQCPAATPTPSPVKKCHSRLLQCRADGDGVTCANDPECKKRCDINTRRCTKTGSGPICSQDRECQKTCTANRNCSIHSDGGTTPCDWPHDCLPTQCSGDTCENCEGECDYDDGEAPCEEHANNFLNARADLDIINHKVDIVSERLFSLGNVVRELESRVYQSTQLLDSFQGYYSEQCGNQSSGQHFCKVNGNLILQQDPRHVYYVMKLVAAVSGIPCLDAALEIVDTVNDLHNLTRTYSTPVGVVGHFKRVNSVVGIGAASDPLRDATKTCAEKIVSSKIIDKGLSISLPGSKVVSCLKFEPVMAFVNGVFAFKDYAIHVKETRCAPGTEISKARACAEISERILDQRIELRNASEKLEQFIADYSRVQQEYQNLLTEKSRLEALVSSSLSRLRTCENSLNVSPTFATYNFLCGDPEPKDRTFCRSNYPNIESRKCGYHNKGGVSGTVSCGLCPQGYFCRGIGVGNLGSEVSPFDASHQPNGFCVRDSD